ncbi:MAG: endonuclease/exonuclease/phosphatase family protein [Leptolyngbya sp. SIOISBB]|nr:endonuclease/exonuclease/phosphatase family protein [Leptolyngbya sp. SIOISBB]
MPLLFPLDADAILQRFRPSFEPVIECHQFSRTVLDPASITVVNWNIAKNNHQTEWLAEAGAIAQRYDPDLFFFQEVRIVPHDQPPIPFDGLGWHFAPNLFDAHNRHAFGVLTAAKVRHLDYQQVHTRHYEPVFNTPKVALITEYPLVISRQTLLAINVHGLNFVRTQQFQAQLHQLEERVTHHPGPLILSGDFNTWNRRRMTVLQSVVHRLGLTQVSFPREQHQRLKRFLFSDPLDHIFYRGLEVRSGSARVLHQLESSDHVPMVVEFRALKHSHPSKRRMG